MNRNEIRQLISSVPSQTSLDERFGLYDLVVGEYTGQGDIYDIGTAAGGSTYCLALGLDHNDKVAPEAKKNRILGFDRFSRYSQDAFKNSPLLPALQEKHGKTFENGLEFFEAVTRDFAHYMQPVKLDLTKDFDAYRKPGRIEIVHIDAAKSLALWQSICPVICEGAIPGQTTFIFQDFSRARLPWQWLFIAELLEGGIAHWAREFDGGTVHLKIEKPIPAEFIENSISFSYSQERAVALWRRIHDFVSGDKSRLTAFRGAFENIANCTLAYIYLYLGQDGLKRETLKKVDPAFLERNVVYESELNTGKIVAS